MSRFTFNCANGCGACDVKLTECETYRSETMDGKLIDRRYELKVVSKCCGSDVDVWDELMQDITFDVIGIVNSKEKTS